MSDAAAKPTAEMKRAKQGRSPAYPAMALKEAIAKAKALYDAQGKYPAPMALAFDAWGHSAKSSAGRDTRAALKYFGLITVEGDGETGKVKLGEDALRILLDDREDQTEKKAIIRRVALNPAIHKKLLEQFPDGIKSDAAVEHFLVFDEKYNKSAAGDVVTEFKATADFAELYKPAKIADKEAEQAIKSPDGGKEVAPAIGNLVQWVPGGQMQFPEPRRVRALSKDGQWVFVDGSDVGLPMAEIEIFDAKVDSIVPPTLPLPVGTRREVFALDEGDVVLTFPDSLSSTSFEDLDAYLKVFISKMRRRAGEAKGP